MFYRSIKKYKTIIADNGKSASDFQADKVFSNRKK